MARKKNLSHNERAAKANRLRESGQPGGGQGRKDDVGRSAVYPMSGPHASGPVETRTAGAWGQGERGAPGSEDHGSSELTYERGQLLEALETHGDSLAAQPQAGNVEIPPEEWIAFFNSFSRQHQGWLANITITQGHEEQTEVRDCRLEGISSDHLSARDEIYLSIGRGDGGHLTHSIKNPMKVVFQRDLRGAHKGLEITSADGGRTSVRFRIAALPETLDGVLEDTAGERTKEAKSRQTSSPPPRSMQLPPRETNVHIPIERTTLEGNLVTPAHARGMVLFAHGSGSSRHSPRNRYVAEVLQTAGFATLLMDLLTAEEEALDERTADMRFDIDVLARRLMGATW